MGTSVEFHNSLKVLLSTYKNSSHDVCQDSFQEWNEIYIIDS